MSNSLLGQAMRHWAHSLNQEYSTRLMNNLYLFFIASLLLNITPGNDMLFVISRSISQGAKGGTYSALGIFLGCLVHIIGAVFGLSIIISKSAFLFDFIKLAGAGYLIYLGMKSLLAKAPLAEANENLTQTAPMTLLKQGIITNVLNPKVAIFFLSFLPQFIDPAAGQVQWQLLMLGLWFAVQGTFVLLLIALVVAKTSNFIKQNPTFWMIQEKITGLILVGLGVKLVLSSK